MNNITKAAALAALTAATALTLTACDPESTPSGTVVVRQGGAPMTAKGATLTIRTDDGKTAVTVIPAGVYESCHVGSTYPACK